MAGYSQFNMASLNISFLVINLSYLNYVKKMLCQIMLFSKFSIATIKPKPYIKKNY